MDRRGSSPTVLAPMQRAAQPARPISERGDSRGTDLREVPRGPRGLAAIDCVAVGPVEHEVVSGGLAVAVHHVPAGVLTGPEEVVPVVVLEGDDWRLNLDRHGP